MAVIFRTGFGSSVDVQRIHQPTVRKLVAHLDSNCHWMRAGDIARRAEMVIILQCAVDKLLEVDGLDLTGRPAFLTDDSV